MLHWFTNNCCYTGSPTTAAFHNSYYQRKPPGGGGGGGIDDADDADKLWTTQFVHLVHHGTITDVRSAYRPFEVSE